MAVEITKKNIVTTIVIVSFILIFFGFFNPFKELETERIIVPGEKILENDSYSVSEDKAYLTLSKEKNKNAANIIIPRLLERLTLLDYKRICFYNKGTKVVYPTGDEDTNVTNGVNFNNNQTILNVSYKSKKCIKFFEEDKFTYKWFFEYMIDYDYAYERLKLIEVYYTKYPDAGLIKRDRHFEMLVISPDTDSSIRLEFWSSVVNTIIVWLAIWVFIYSMFNIFIKKER